MNVPINPTIIPIIEITVNIVCHFTLFLTAISPCGQSESLSYVFRINLPTSIIITNNIPLKTNKPSISFFSLLASRLATTLIAMSVSMRSSSSAVMAAVLSVDSFCICSTSLSGWLSCLPNAHRRFGAGFSELF